MEANRAGSAIAQAAAAAVSVILTLVGARAAAARFNFTLLYIAFGLTVVWTVWLFFDLMMGALRADDKRDDEHRQ